MQSLYDADADELSAVLGDQPDYRVRQVLDGLYRRDELIEEMTSLPKALRAEIATRLPAALEPAAEAVGDEGQTIKWLWRLHDDTRIETVLMLYPQRATVCVSTQAGCAMACGFCATGQAGFDRHLSVGEIVEQVVRARRRAAPRRVSNVVFMGMGEPLANYDNTVAALRRLQGPMGISARHLTVSTVGIIGGIRRLAGEGLPVSLAVSLHAANDELRDELVPINRRYPLAQLQQACSEWTERTGRRVSFEWAMIDGVNDRPSDARELATIASSLRAHVNLIPLNPTPGYQVRGSARERVTTFCSILEDLGVNVTVRHNRGTAIDAACGQLRATHDTAASSPVQLSAPTRSARSSCAPPE